MLSARCPSFVRVAQRRSGDGVGGGVRVLGQALLGIGLVAAVFGVLLLEDLVGLAENRTGLDTFGAFLIGLGYTALFATPGILVALVGWGLVRQVGPATEERSPPSWGLGENLRLALHRRHRAPVCWGRGSGCRSRLRRRAGRLV